MERLKPWIPVVGLLTLVGAGASTNYLQIKANKKLNRIERRLQKGVAVDSTTAEAQKIKQQLVALQQEYKQAMEGHGNKDQVMQKLLANIQDLSRQHTEAVNVAAQNAQLLQALGTYAQKLRAILEEKGIAVPQR